MPSVCELKIELKKKGIKGISGLNKAGLEELLATGKSAPPKSKSKSEPKSEPKPAPKEAPTPKLLKMKELSPKTQPKKYQTTPLKTLIRLEENTEKLMNDESVQMGEKVNAEKTLIDIQKAIALRPPKEVELERKKLLEDIDLKQLKFIKIDLEKKIKNRKLPASDILKYRARLTRLNKVFKAKNAALFNDSVNF
jgi:DNA polymerase/3'-5' exonuclease PolX